MFSNFNFLKIDIPQNFETCKICNKESPNFVLMDCGDRCCTFCADSLVDSTETYSQKLLFVCPFCKKNVNSIKINGVNER